MNHLFNLFLTVLFFPLFNYFIIGYIFWALISLQSVSLSLPQELMVPSSPSSLFRLPLSYLQIMDIQPDSWLWRRERPAYHGGAMREYLRHPSDNGKYVFIFIVHARIVLASPLHSLLPFSPSPSSAPTRFLHRSLPFDFIYFSSACIPQSLRTS